MVPHNRFRDFNIFITVAIKHFSKKDDKCPFNASEQDIVERISRSSKAESGSTKACPIFYTGPPTKKSICEQRRIEKCVKYEKEHACKFDKMKCEHGLAPDCVELPDKIVPGRDDVKNIPGCPKIGWERMTK